jgi:hypothetical protein
MQASPSVYMCLPVYLYTCLRVYVSTNYKELHDPQSYL